MLIGYARVSGISTDEQHLQLQLDALKKAGCKRVFTEKAGGARTERQGLAEALSHLREQDALVVWKLVESRSGAVELGPAITCAPALSVRRCLSS